MAETAKQEKADTHQKERKPEHKVDQKETSGSRDQTSTRLSREAETLLGDFKKLISGARNEKTGLPELHFDGTAAGGKRPEDKPASHAKDSGKAVEDLLKLLDITDVFAKRPNDKAAAKPEAGLNSADTQRRIVERLAFLNSLPPAIRKELGGPERPIDAKEVSRQIKDGSLKEGPYSILLQNVDKKFEELQNKDETALVDRGRELERLNRIKGLLTEQLAEHTKQGVGLLDRMAFWSGTTEEFQQRQAELVRQVREMEQKIEDKTRAVQEASGRVQLMELMEKANEHSKLMLSGKIKEADRKAIQMWGEYGQDLSRVAPSVWHELTGASGNNAFERLKNAGEAYTGAMPSLGGGFNEGLKALRQLNCENGNLVDADAIRRQALRALESDPEVQALFGGANKLAKDLPVLQEMFQSGMQGTKFEEFVKDARQRGADIEQTLKQMEEHVPEVKERLAELKRLEAETTDQKTKEELKKRIEGFEQALKLCDPESETRKGLDNMIKMLNSPNFDESTFLNWLKTEGVIIGAAIGCAVAAVATVVTWGATSPLLIAAVAATGALVGSEITKEGLYHLDIGLGDGSRSKAGSYLTGEKVYDAAGGTWRDQTLLGDVVLPYAKQWAVDFAFSVGTMGLGMLASKGINTCLAGMGPNAMSSFLRKSGDVINTMTGRTNRVQAELAKQDNEPFRKFMKEFVEECGDELKEATTEAALQKALGNTNSAAGFLASAILATKRGVRFDMGKGTQVNVEAGDLNGFNSALDQFRSDGHKVEVTGDGTARVTVDGKRYDLKFSRNSERTISEPEIPTREMKEQWRKQGADLTESTLKEFEKEFADFRADLNSCTEIRAFAQMLQNRKQVMAGLVDKQGKLKVSADDAKTVLSSVYSATELEQLLAGNLENNLQQEKQRTEQLNKLLGTANIGAKDRADYLKALSSLINAEQNPDLAAKINAFDNRLKDVSALSETNVKEFLGRVSDKPISLDHLVMNSANPADLVTKLKGTEQIALLADLYKDSPEFKGKSQKQIQAAIAEKIGELQSRIESNLQRRVELVTAEHPALEGARVEDIQPGDLKVEVTRQLEEAVKARYGQISDASRSKISELVRGIGSKAYAAKILAKDGKLTVIWADPSHMDNSAKAYMQTIDLSDADAGLSDRIHIGLNTDAAPHGVSNIKIDNPRPNQSNDKLFVYLGKLGGGSEKQLDRLVQEHRVKGELDDAATLENFKKWVKDMGFKGDADLADFLGRVIRRK